jgi:hypothetical protein
MSAKPLQRLMPDKRIGLAVRLLAGMGMGLDLGQGYPAENDSIILV